MLPKHNQLSGILGENIAVQYLSGQGYTIIERNFKKRYGEIDIIALQNDTLVFVEVKTRKGNMFGEGVEAITSWKRQTLIKAAQYYKLLHPHLPDYMRIDVISIALTEDNRIDKLEHFENITL